MMNATVNAKLRIPNISSLAEGTEQSAKQFCAWIKELAQVNKYSIEFFEPKYSRRVLREDEDILYMVGDKGELMALAAQLDGELNGPQSYEESFTELVQDLQPA
jgi:hypothetical protein